MSPPKDHVFRPTGGHGTVAREAVWAVEPGVEVRAAAAPAALAAARAAAQAAARVVAAKVVGWAGLGGLEG